MFQVLDDKGSCVGIYKDGELYFKNIPTDLDSTWNYVEFLKGQDIQYAQIYAEGKTLEECCPSQYILQYKAINSKLKAFLNSFKEAKVSLKENCFFDLTPARFLKESCELKNRISQHVFDNYKKPSEYTFYREFTELLSSISHRELKIDRDILKGRLYTPQGQKLFEKVNSGQTSLKFNMFSSVTGRLTVADKSFPILNLSSKLRDIIKPTNDWFVSFDLNAAEMRVALALAGENQPEGDLHDYIRKEVFDEGTSRTEAKTISTQWLYDSRNENTLKYDDKLNKVYNKKKLLGDYWRGGDVLTPYGRKISSDLHHVISYLCQSTLIDMFHRQILKVDKLLGGKQSFIAFPLHDQLVIDLHNTDKKMLPDIIKTLSDTPYGNFPVKVEIGADFGNMKKVNIKV